MPFHVMQCNAIHLTPSRLDHNLHLGKCLPTHDLGLTPDLELVSNYEQTKEPPLSDFPWITPSPVPNP